MKKPRRLKVLADGTDEELREAILAVCEPMGKDKWRRWKRAKVIKERLRVWLEGRTSFLCGDVRALEDELDVFTSITEDGTFEIRSRVGNSHHLLSLKTGFATLIKYEEGRYGGRLIRSSKPVGYYLPACPSSRAKVETAAAALPPLAARWTVLRVTRRMAAH